LGEIPRLGNNCNDIGRVKSLSLLVTERDSGKLYVGYLSIGFIVAKTNTHVWCWIRCSNICTLFSVPCLCGLVYAIFILL